MERNLQKINNGMVLFTAVLMLAACGSGDGDTSIATPAAQHAVEQQSDDRTTGSNVRVLGGINARLNGERRAWFVTGEKDGAGWRSQSDVNAFGNAYAVSIYGHAVAETRQSNKDALLIGATVREVGPDLHVTDIEITYLKDGFGSGSYSSSNDGDVVVNVATIGNDNGLLKITGTFSATLPYRKYSSRDAEPNNIVTIEAGRFNVNLPPLLK